MPYVNHRWLGGLLTNFQTISQRIRRLHDLERYETEGQLALLPTRERMAAQADLAKLRANLGGVKNMQRVPDAMFVIDLKTEEIAVKEAQPSADPDHRPRRHQLRPRRDRVRGAGQRRRDPLLRADHAGDRPGRLRGPLDLPRRGGKGAQGGRGKSAGRGRSARQARSRRAGQARGRGAGKERGRGEGGSRARSAAAAPPQQPRAAAAATRRAAARRELRRRAPAAAAAAGLRLHLPRGRTAPRRKRPPAAASCASGRRGVDARARRTADPATLEPQPSRHADDGARRQPAKAQSAPPETAPRARPRRRRRSRPTETPAVSRPRGRGQRRRHRRRAI